MKSVTAFAPATIANVAVGFDILGFPIDNVGDTVTVSKIDEPGLVEIDRISGDPSTILIPGDANKNTATIGLIKLCHDLNLDHGFRVSINKGIPLSSGMGGSAASAVAAIVAANVLLNRPLNQKEMIEYALEGETAASGSKHSDNVAPCMMGGLILSQSNSRFIRIPVPADMYCVLVHPEIKINTTEARAILKTEISLKDHIAQSANLAGFVAGCFQFDLNIIRDSFSDLIIEPQRAHLIPGFEQVKNAALKLGALGCSISGSGPSIFAWTDNYFSANEIRQAMVKAFLDAGVYCVDAWISPISSKGARLV